MLPTTALKYKTHMAENHRIDSKDANSSNVNILDYFRSSINTKADKKANMVIMQRINNELSDVFTGIGCSEGTFKLTVKEDSHPYKTSPRRVAYAIQQFLKEEFDRLQEQQINVPLDVDETLEWCNRLVLVPKANSKLQLCLDLPRLNKVLIRPVHRGPTLNDILMH